VSCRLFPSVVCCEAISSLHRRSSLHLRSSFGFLQSEQEECAKAANAAKVRDFTTDGETWSFVEIVNSTTLPLTTTTWDREATCRGRSCTRTYCIIFLSKRQSADTTVYSTALYELVARRSPSEPSPAGRYDYCTLLCRTVRAIQCNSVQLLYCAGGRKHVGEHRGSTTKRNGAFLHPPLDLSLLRSSSHGFCRNSAPPAYIHASSPRLNSDSRQQQDRER
jgi:hypothetical protein